MTPSWYDVLDVEPSASSDEIRAAWRAGIADLEPGSRRFQTLNEAAEVLLDEQKRSAYDAELAGPAAPAATRAPRREEKAARQQESAVRGVRPSTISTWLLALLGMLAAGCLAAALWVWQSTDEASAEEATSQAQAAAERAIVPVLSYDHETLDADRERAVAYLTGDYREDYDQLFEVISENAPSTETKVAAEVLASGIVRSGEDRVEVLVFVDRPTTNKLTPEPVVYKDQVTVTMQKVGEDWLIDNLVTSPAQQ